MILKSTKTHILVLCSVIVDVTCRGMDSDKVPFPTSFKLELLLIMVNFPLNGLTNT